MDDLRHHLMSVTVEEGAIEGLLLDVVDKKLIHLGLTPVPRITCIFYSHGTFYVERSIVFMN